MGSSVVSRPIPHRSSRKRRPGRRLAALGALAAVLALTLSACFPPAEPGAPILATSTWVGGLSKPWDLAFLPGGAGIYTENDSGKIWGRFSDTDRNHLLGQVQTFATSPAFDPSGEGGLMGIAIDPDWSTNHRVYVCYSTTADNRVARFTLDPAAGTPIANWTPIVTGIPHAGNHNGCRVRFQPGTGALFVSTGDAAQGPAPQDDASLGGKILRIDTDGNAWPGNTSGTRWYTEGHRNPQGLAFRPGTDQPFSVEHGPGVNDEVNQLTNGGNAGWDPNTSGTYDQSKPMTGPLATIQPTWASGGVTVAPSGGTFLSGAKWKNWDGALVVACLDGDPTVGQRLLVMHVSADGTTLTAPAVTALNLGVRLRSAVQGPDGDLYVTTDVDGGGGAIWRIIPV